jgi:DNA replication regulator DPB11
LIAIERLRIAEDVKANGGVYEGDLTKQISHLISFRVEGAKYKAAKSWGLKIVSIEWLHDSLERGMILDEALYDPALPEEERGKGAWDRTKPRRPILGKRQRDESISGAEGSKRKLRRTASKKLNSQSEGMWGDIAAGVGGSFAQVSRSGVWEPTDDQFPVGASEAQREEHKGSSKTAVAPAPPIISGIFSGCRFFLDGFEAKKQEVLGNHLIPHGAELSTSAEGLLVPGRTDSMRLFRIVPSNKFQGENTDLQKTDLKVDTITEWWVERCLHRKSFSEPSENVIGRPFPKFPISEFGSMIISSAAFTGIDLLHLKKAVELIGAKYSEDMTPQSTILLTRSVTLLRKDKADHAKEWNIPIVDATWLWDSITAGEKLSTQKYRLRLPKRSGSAPTEGISSKSKQHSDRSKSDLTKSITGPDSQASNTTRPPRNSKLDRTAFISDEPLPGKSISVKEEVDSQAALPMDNETSTFSSKTEPLSEISHNHSPSRTVSTAPAPSDHPAPRPQEDFSNDISNLLTKTRTAAQPAQTEANEGRKRNVSRILGRAVSNVSAASTRASSVDSTATHGNPVEYPSNSNHSGKIASGHTREVDPIEHLINAGNRNIEKDIDSQPRSTQLQYEDPQSREYKERVMARMVGEKVDPKRKWLTKEKGITMGDISESREGAKVRGRRSGKPTPGIR